VVAAKPPGIVARVAMSDDALPISKCETINIPVLSLSVSTNSSWKAITPFEAENEREKAATAREHLRGTHAHCRATELRSYLRHTADRKLGGSGLVETVAGDDESGAR
jgi:hypothetical protein